MITKRTHGPCTCGQKHADPTVSCSPECASIYPAQQEPDALTRLARWVRAQETHIVTEEAMFEALALISEAREEQSRHGETQARLAAAEDTIRNLRAEVTRLRKRLDQGLP